MAPLNPVIDGGGEGTAGPNNDFPPIDKNELQRLLDEGKALLEQGTTLDQLEKDYPLIAKALQQEYGYALTFIYSDPELLKLFSQALRQGFTEEGFQNALEGTKWWSDRTASQREYDIRAKSPNDKLTLDQRRQDIIDEMKTIAMQQNGLQLDDATLYNYADEILRNHFNDANVTPLLTRFVKKTFVDAGQTFKFGGEAGMQMDALRQYANDMGVFMNDESLGTYVDKIFAEETTDADVRKMIQSSAVGYYSQFADRINAGETVKSIIDPYRQLIASMLDMPDGNAVDFINNDGTPAETLMQKAMFGGQNGKAMSLYDLQKEIKKDSRWLKTTGAQNEYSNIAQGISRMFGGGY